MKKEILQPLWNLYCSSVCTVLLCS